MSTGDVVAFVPLKLESQRVTGKNRRILGGKPLWHWIIDALLEATELSEVHVFASPAWFSEVKEFGHQSVRSIHRSPDLDGDDISGSQLYKAFAEEVPSRFYLLAHATSPFLQARTVDECINAVIHGPFDSALTVARHQTFVRNASGDPLNFSANNMPPTQRLSPVYSDTSGLYLFSEEQLRSGQRTGDAPFLKEVDLIEGLDIDSEKDLSLAEQLSGLRMPASAPINR